MTTSVSICIPTYSGGHRLERLFASLAAGGVDFESDELLVYDDGSPDEKVAAIRAVFESVPIRSKQLLRDATNRGWTEANARLVRASSRKIDLLLNDDVTLPVGFMSVLRDLMATLPGAGALSWRSCGMSEYDSQTPVPGLLQLATHIAGYCMAFHRSVYESVGGLDGRFRYYCSDSDIALRMTMAGHPSYRVWWPLIPHEGGASTKESPELERPSDAAARDLTLWNEKWGGESGPDMEKVALAQLFQMAEVKS